jgi:hypothetical protein
MDFRWRRRSTGRFASSSDATTSATTWCLPRLRPLAARMAERFSWQIEPDRIAPW